MNMKLRNVLSSISVALTLATAVCANAAVTPKNGATVDLLTENQKTCVSLSTSKRATWLANNPTIAQTLTDASPLVISWDGDSGDCSVTVTESATGKVYLQTTAKSPVDCYNLRAGYDYQLKIKGSSIDSTTTFKTSATAPRVIWCNRLFYPPSGDNRVGVPNFRDLGGYKGLNGKRVRQGLIYRSAAFNEKAGGASAVNDTVRAFAIDQLGIKTDIDLREDGENYPDMSTSPLGKSVNYYNFPSTAYSLKKNGSYMQAAKVLFDKTKLPAVFHCQGGRDRGGTLPVPILALLGVSEADIYLDYMFTGTSLNMPPRSDPGKFVNVLSAIKAMSGSTLAEQAAAFFKQSGFTDAEIAAFRAIMLEDGTEEEATTHTHDWSDWTVTKTATCTEDGSRTRTCSADDCPYGGTQTETIEALGHDWGAWTTVREKSEELPGLEERTCSRCKKTEQRETGRIVPTELPDAYTACTWVGSTATGKQWFDTKLAAADFTHVNVDFEFTAWGGDDVSSLVGARWVDTTDSTTNDQIIVSVQNASAAWFGGQGTYSAGSPAEKAFEGLTAAKLNTRYSLKNRADGSHIYLGNGSTTNDLKLKNGHYEGAATLGVFAMNDTQAGKVWRHASAKVYSLQIYNGRWTSEKSAELVRNYIPCQRNADGVYGFYDMITGDFAVSASSDAFVGEGGSATTHTHVWSDWKVTTAATCAEAGERTRTCSADDCAIGTQTEAIPATGKHDYYWIIDKEATETEAGHRHQQCNVCEGWGAEEDISATGGGSGDDDDPVTGDITPLPSTAIVCIGDSLTQGHKGRGIVAGECPANYCGGLLAGSTNKISKAYPYYLSLLVDSKRDVYNVSRGSATTGMMLASLLPGEPKITKDLVFTSSSRTVELTDKDTKFELKGLDTGAAIPVISTSEKMVDVGRQAMVGTFANGVRVRFNQFTAKIQSDVKGTERRWVEIVGDVTDTVTVPSGTAFTTDVSLMCDNTILILHLGANDISDTYQISHEVYVQQMKDYLDAHCKTGRYIVMSSATDTSKASMAHFASAFGDHFLNLKSVLDSEGMAIAKAKGLFAADSTVEWDASDSAGLLAGDRLHYNDNGNQVVAQIVYNKLDALGYLSDAPVHVHKYGEWVIDTPATETTPGSKHRVCECGEAETAVIPATGEPSSGYVPAKPTPYAANTIVCIGDSLTGGEKACEKVSSSILPANYCPDVFAGKTVSDVFKTYPCYLAERVGSGFNVENVARGGAETAQMIGLMTPGLPLTRNDFTLGPTTTKVSFGSNIGIWDAKYNSKYYLNTSSIPVGDSFAAGAGKYTVIGDFGGILRARYSCVSEGSCAAAFVDGPDADVVVPAGTPFTSDVSLMCSNTIQVILLGANDGLKNYTNWVGIIKNHVTSGVASGRYVVLSPHATTSSPKLRSDDLETYMAEQFGEHYVNLFAELNTNGMVRAKAKGYVAAESTADWNTADGLLSTDDLHFNDAGKKVMADIVYDKLVALGYLSGELPHAHVWGEWIVDQEATETTAGSKHRVCECGETEYAVIPATGGGEDPVEPTPVTGDAWGWSNRVTIAETDYCVLAFTNTAETGFTWTVPGGVTAIDYLVVGGGSGGAQSTADGTRATHGGNAGAFVESTTPVTAGTTLQIAVGAGGASGAAGGASSLGTIATAAGGTAVEGVSSVAASYGGDGGAGAGGVGGAGTDSVGGAGGMGKVSSITGSEQYYAAGGGGGKNGGGGSGIGGNGGASGSSNGTGASGTSGVAGTGSGGGGCGRRTATGGNKGAGGSGIVIVRYAVTGGETPVEPPAHQHVWGDWTTVTAATCMEPGLEQRSCTASGCTVPVATETREIAALEHDMGDWYVYIEPQVGVAGERRRDCERAGCGYFESEAIDPLPEKEGEPSSFSADWGRSSVLTDGSTVLVFTNVAETMNWLVPEGVTNVRYLVVAGGGAGGGRAGGGGGAGGLLAGDALAVTPGGALAITVGAGGVNTNGCNSSIGADIVAIGGGQGGVSTSGAPSAGKAGGSGGGANGYSGQAGGLGTEGQGFAGGKGYGRSGGGGGGGAGGAGGDVLCNDSNKTGAVGGQGGLGFASDITGTVVAYAGGGGGGGNVDQNLSPTNCAAAAGGATAFYNGGYAVAGGGQGATDTRAATAGTDGLGGGGGGGAYAANTTGGKGGDGVVILRYMAAGGDVPVGPTGTVYEKVGADVYNEVSSFGASVDEEFGWRRPGSEAVDLDHDVGAAYDYVIPAGAVLANRQENGTDAFAGKSLTIADGGLLVLSAEEVEGKVQTTTINGLVGNGGAVKAFGREADLTIAGTLSVPQGQSLTFQQDGYANNSQTQVLTVASTVVGAGTIRLECLNSRKTNPHGTDTFVLSGDASGFTGILAAEGAYAPEAYNLYITGAFGGAIASVPAAANSVKVNYAGLVGGKGLKVATTTVPAALKSGLTFVGDADFSAADLPLMTFPAGAEVSAADFAVSYAAALDAEPTAFTGLAMAENEDGTVTLMANAGAVPSENPTVDGQDVEAGTVFTVADSERPITYPTVPEVTGEIGAQQIAFGAVTVDVPRYYTATLEGNVVSLALNGLAKPEIADGTTGEEEKEAFVVSDGNVALHLENVYPALYYTLEKATALGASPDWTEVETKQGAADFETAAGGDSAFYRIVVRDVPQ